MVAAPVSNRLVSASAEHQEQADFCLWFLFPRRVRRRSYFRWARFPWTCVLRSPQIASRSCGRAREVAALIDIDQPAPVVFERAGPPCARLIEAEIVSSVIAVRFDDALGVLPATRWCAGGLAGKSNRRMKRDREKTKTEDVRNGDGCHSSTMPSCGARCALTIP